MKDSKKSIVTHYALFILFCSLRTSPLCLVAFTSRWVEWGRGCGRGEGLSLVFLPSVNQVTFLATKKFLFYTEAVLGILSDVGETKASLAVQVNSKRQGEIIEMSTSPRHS